MGNFIAENYILILVLTGVSLLGASAGLIGCFAVLRRRSLTGDALAHAALPGLCLAFLFLGERNLPAMLFGALMAGLLGVSVISAIRRHTRIKEDAAIGIVLSVFFGLGVVLKRVIQRVPGGSKAGLDSYIFGQSSGMSSADLYWIVGLTLLTLLAVVILYKEFQLVAFDSDFARAQGWPTVVLDLMLMGLIALAVVVGLPTVGVLMIASLLIVPAASARFWTERLANMLWLSAMFGVLSGILGTIMSSTFDLPTGPAIILTSSTLFLGSLILGSHRVRAEHVLKYHYKSRSASRYTF